MFNFFKKTTKKSENPNLKSEIIKLSGLHCTSCAVNIDLALEDLPSVQAKTNYAKSEVKVSFDPNHTSIIEIKSIIISLDYQIT